MLTRFSSAIVVLALLTSAGCAKKVDVTASRTALQAADTEWSNAAGNVDSFMTFLAADGSIMPPNEPAATGTDAVRTWATNMMAMPGFHVAWQSTAADVAQSGELGYTTGTYELQMQGPNGAPMNDHGKYLSVWKKDAGGAWKVAYDTFNSDVPMAVPAAPADTTATPNK